MLLRVSTIAICVSAVACGNPAAAPVDGAAGATDGAHGDATPLSGDFALAFAGRRAHDGSPAVWLWHSKDGHYDSIAGTAPCGSVSATPSGQFLACDMILKGPAIIERSTRQVVRSPISDPASCGDPVLTSDATRVFCNAYGRENQLGWQLWTYLRAGGAATVITDQYNYNSPTVRPDNQRVAAAISGFKSGIGDMKLDGSDFRMLYTNANAQRAVRQPSYDRASTRVVFLECGGPGPHGGLTLCDVYIVDANGGAATRLTNTPGLKDGPVFSLDGSKIYYLQAESDQLQNIVELDIASQTTKVIATDIHENDQVGVSGSQTLALLPE